MNKRSNLGTMLIVGGILLFLFFVTGGSELLSFEDPLNNKYPDPDLSEWGANPALPAGWSFSGWSHGDGWNNLIQSTTTVKLGDSSVAFIDKGYNGNIAETPCDDWCTWTTAKTPIYSRSLVSARYYIFPVSFTSYSGSTDGVRTSLNFYDAAGSYLSSVSGPTLDESFFFSTGSWQELRIEGVAPSNAKSAAITYTIATRSSNQFVTSFYVDDIWIEGVLCEEDWTCEDWDYCKGGYETRTCTDQNKCNLFFNKPAESRSCDASIETHISDFKKGDLSIIGLMEEITNWRGSYLTTEELISMWEETRTVDSDGDGQKDDPSWHISEAYMGWQDSTAIHSMLTMYDATGETYYLDLAKERLDWQMSQWPFEGANWDKGGRPSNDRASGGNVVENFLRFAYFVKRDSLDQYSLMGTDYFNFVKTNFLDYWKADTVTFEQNGIPMGCVAEGDKNPYWYCERFNAMLQIHTSYLYTYLLTGDEEWKDLAIRGANLFKYKGLHLIPNCDGSLGDHYEWGYRVDTGETYDNFPDLWGTYESGHKEDLHYSVHDIKAVRTFWENGIVFTDQDMERFANTFVHASWNGDMADPLFFKEATCWRDPNFGDLHNGYESGYTHGMTLLNEFSPTLKQITENQAVILYQDGVSSGSFWSDYYKCIDSAEFGKICYSSVRTEPDMQMSSIANIIYMRSILGE